MATTFLSSARRVLANVWGVLDAARRTVLNLLFLAIIVAIAVALLRSGTPALAEKTTLVLALKGPLVEQRGGTVNVVRVGTYKSAVEPFIADGPSPAAREADQLLYGSLWQTWMDGVEKARKLPPQSIEKLIDELPQRAAAAGGDLARLAL